MVALVKFVGAIKLSQRKRVGAGFVDLALCAYAGAIWWNSEHSEEAEVVSKGLAYISRGYQTCVESEARNFLVYGDFEIDPGLKIVAKRNLLLQKELCVKRQRFARRALRSSASRVRRILRNWPDVKLSKGSRMFGTPIFVDGWNIIAVLTLAFGSLEAGWAARPPFRAGGLGNVELEG